MNKLAEREASTSCRHNADQVINFLNDTAADLVTAAATQEAPYGFASAAQANDIAIEFNKLRADFLALKKVVNSIIDDQQAYGWFQ